jgi:prepilin-type N-terminal cleavage/methylation domain-containing protein
MNQENQAAQKGFTLVELLVSIGIFTAITTVSVLNNSRFNSSVLLTNLAYEIGLSVRQAQFYGITVRGTSADPTKFDSGYGVRFDTTSPTTFVMYEDVRPVGGSPNHIKDAGDLDLETFRIQKGNRISKVCVDGVCTNAIVDITFIRPNPDAYIRASNNTSISYGKAEICVESPSATRRKVVVESTGQISVTADATICN